MTGSSISETGSQNRNGSVCSEDDKASNAECTAAREKNERNVSASSSEKSNATYTKGDSKVTIQKPLRKVSYVQTKAKSEDLGLPVPRSSLRCLRRNEGIQEPTFLASQRAHWLMWNDPVFTRRRSMEDQRLCKRIASNSVGDQKSTVASFKRSLQLLGLKDKDLGLNYDTKDIKNENKIPRGRATPTFSTQLKQRSVSLTNLRNAVQESGLPTFQAIEKMHRDILSRAVYEEWYFRKQTENKIRKELEDEIKKKQEQELEWIKLERKQRAEENFEKWKKRKMQLNKENRTGGTTNKGSNTSSYANEKPGPEGAFEAWKAKKDEEMKTKSDIKKRLEEEKRRKHEEEEKKTAADAAFRTWKQNIDDELKNKLKEREREKKLAEEKKEKEKREKQENAKASFLKWKIDKDKEIKQHLIKKRSKAKQMAEEITMQRKEREYEASQAFEEWLDQVDERVQNCKTRKNSLKTESVPWYPT